MLTSLLSINLLRPPTSYPPSTPFSLSAIDILTSFLSYDYCSLTDCSSTDYYSSTSGSLTSCSSTGCSLTGDSLTGCSLTGYSLTSGSLTGGSSLVVSWLVFLDWLLPSRQKLSWLASVTWPTIDPFSDINSPFIYRWQDRATALLTVDGRIDGRIDRRIDRRIDKRIDKRIDGRLIEDW